MCFFKFKFDYFFFGFGCDFVRLAATEQKYIGCCYDDN